MVPVALVLLSAAVFFGSTYAIYRFGFYSPNKRQNDDYAVASTPQMDARHEEIRCLIHAARELPFESVHIRSHDGLLLTGRYYHRQDGAPLSICFHGYRGTPTRDFSGGIQIMLRQGHNVLMVEERAHCSSQGHTITLGVKERFDCLDWIRYALDRFGSDTKIILVGISMGASTVLMASGLPLPRQVVGIAADCPYSSPEAIIRKLCGDMKLPGGIFTRLASLSAALYGHFDLKSASALDAVRLASVPILLIHGEEDHFVPCEMSREIYTANPDRIELHLFPGAGHGLSFLVDPIRYEAVIRDFHRRILPE